MDLGGSRGGSVLVANASNEVQQVARPSSALSTVGGLAGLNVVAPEPEPSYRPGAADSAVVLNYEKRAMDEEIHDYSLASSLSFFVKHSYRDVGRRKCHFCLSFCSVFIVVWSALVINTLVEKGPIVFLKLAEGL